MQPTKTMISLLPLALCSCASIVSKSDWPVTVTSIPENAEVEILNEDGQVVHTGHTPFTVTLESGAGYFNGETYSLNASAPGYGPGSAKLDSQLNGWYAGNLIFGGLLGLLIIDPATGAMWRLPDTVQVTLPRTQA